ncbi:MAG: nuclear transport factor 2 family protein [Bacteroidota bacterium]
MKALSLCLFATLLIWGCQSSSEEQDLPTDTENYAVLVDTEGPDHQAVEAAILDYVEGIYEVDSTRIERSVHPELRKRGYWYNKNEEAYADNLDMSFDQLVHLAATWNRSGERANAESLKKIEIYDINDRTASAKLSAEWGIDYFHLAKLDGKWMIMNVLWQSIKEDTN